ncbi:zinc finger protein 211 [Cimex lectularius]|uniref:C2H2-type domain-containing protein n=1 Tax=Cimex lectularius TaxID=79782 RepID=A0A8I6S345_CIMLE|nr:zinc finger protein 211 [Cimex lectularius]
MTLPMVTCPLCCRPGFNTSDSLCSALLDVASRMLCCPICSQVISGLDKFTIHLFSHSAVRQVQKADNSADLETAADRNLVELVKDDSEQTSSSIFCIRSENSQLVSLKANDALNFKNVTINARNFITNTNISESTLASKETSKRKFSELFDHDETDKSPDQMFYRSGGESINSWPSTPSVASVPDNVVSNSNEREFESCKELLTKGDFSTGGDYALETGLEETGVNNERPKDELQSENNTFTCDTCTYTFPNKTILAMHKQLVHKKEENDGSKRKMLVCPHCPRTFSLRSSLMIHNRVAHAGGFSGVENGQKKPEHSCNICGKFFKKQVHLLQHLKVHDEKQWQCSICSKKFTTKYFLKKHRRLHTGEMPYTCQICNKSFTFQQSYHKHLLYHTNDKPYCCSKCGRLFKELSTLHNHERIHSGEKPFTCETCGKAFRQRVSYLVHRRIHTGVMPYKCTACNKCFRYKISQRTHKCMAEPPGVVVRSEGYLVHRLQAALNKEQEGENGGYSINVVVSTSDLQESPKIDSTSDFVVNEANSHIENEEIAFLNNNTTTYIEKSKEKISKTAHFINTKDEMSLNDNSPVVVLENETERLPKPADSTIQHKIAQEKILSVPSERDSGLDPFESIDGDLIKILSPGVSEIQNENTFFDSFSDDALKELLFGSVK